MKQCRLCDKNISVFKKLLFESIRDCLLVFFFFEFVNVFNNWKAINQQILKYRKISKNNIGCITTDFWSFVFYDHNKSMFQNDKQFVNNVREKKLKWLSKFFILILLLILVYLWSYFHIYLVICGIFCKLYKFLHTSYYF